MSVCRRVVICLVLLFPLAAAPCWVCYVPKTPAEQLQKSAIVFVGRVVMTDNREIAKFSVHEVFRGKVGKQEQMDLLQSTCAFPLQNGETYLVYTSRSEKGYLQGASQCSRTARVADAADDLKFLREQRFQTR